jgi:protein-tyrosine kinase
MKASSDSPSTDVRTAAGNSVISVDQAQGERGGEWLDAVQWQGRDQALALGRYSQQKLGEIMVMLELLSVQDRDNVLMRQPDLGLLFGECCLKLKLIDADGLSQALAWQFGLLSPAAKAFNFGDDLVSLSRPLSPYAEALRSISQRLMSAWIQPGRNVVAITSPDTGEGRSHLAANLAIILDQAGWRILLVDADFRKPKQHLNFDAPQHPGLSRLLCGFAPNEVVRRIPYLNRLSLVTSGPLPPNPSELLSRHDLTVFLETAREQYDMVLVDTPAAANFADAELISNAAGSAIIVARKNKTRDRDVRELAGSLKKNGVSIAGTILNVC